MSENTASQFRRSLEVDPVLAMAGAGKEIWMEEGAMLS